MPLTLRHPSALEVGARKVSWFLELLNNKENQAEIVGESIVIKIAIYLAGWQSLAYCTGLENQQSRNGLGGSNPSPVVKVTGGEPVEKWICEVVKQLKHNQFF